MLCDEGAAFSLWELTASTSSDPAIPMGSNYILAVINEMLSYSNSCHHNQTCPWVSSWKWKFKATFPGSVRGLPFSCKAWVQMGCIPYCHHKVKFSFPRISISHWWLYYSRGRSFIDTKSRCFLLRTKCKQSRSEWGDWQDCTHKQQAVNLSVHLHMHECPGLS